MQPRVDSSAMDQAARKVALLGRSASGKDIESARISIEICSKVIAADFGYRRASLAVSQKVLLSRLATRKQRHLFSMRKGSA
ncbi:hypothetical protein EVC45_31995 [Paraburkholderia sp. UYCP14C]|uniref:hypothetical protein n=1 Tax=Paraburkholderia sp. UYCP14C TaxID=2511130 RepID=UPI0010202130|nr:hypothetical protein [Paraburkholderia sp. UYCP14C]RZF25767.1 hypothetical protein EVC45_31995 [Paraburkholderia sp. UYCP14C]